MLLGFHSPESVLLHNLIYPLPQAWKVMLISKQGQKNNRDISGLETFSILVPPKLLEEHQPRSLHLVVHCQLTLHSNSHKNEINPSTAVRTKCYSLAHARTTAQQGWSFSKPNSLPGVWTNSFLPGRKIGENWKSLRGLTLVKRLE